MSYVIVCLLMLLASPAFAGQRDLDREVQRVAEQRKAPLDAKELSDLQTRGWRDRRVGEFDPPVSNTSRPADYVSDVNRGTIEYVGRQPGETRSRWRNYSLHTVLIPDGTVIDGESNGGCNFTQIEPKTEAVNRSPGFGHNLIFRHCNLVNVQTYPDWDVKECNTAQIDQMGTFDSEGSVLITNSQFVASTAEEVPVIRSKPLGVIERTSVIVEVIRP